MKTRTHRRPAWLPVVLLVPLVAVACQDPPMTAPEVSGPSWDALQDPEDFPAPDILGFDQGDMALSWTWSDDQGWDQVGFTVFVDGAAVRDKWTEKNYDAGEELSYSWTAATALEPGSYTFCVEVMAKNKEGKRPTTYHEQACIEVEIGEAPPPEGEWTVVDHGLGTVNGEGQLPNLTSIWGSASNDIFVVGTDGTAWHYNGVWEEMTTSTEASLVGVWGSSGNDVYAAAGDYVLHYAGSTWTQTPLSSVLSSPCLNSPYANGVWGSSAGDLYFPGDCSYPGGGVIFHYDGLASWTMAGAWAQESQHGIWGSGAGDVFSVGNNTVIRHFDGTGWEAMTDYGEFSYSPLQAVWGSSGDNVFAVGDAGSNVGLIVHYDGTDWSAMEIPTGAEGLFGIWGSASDDVFAVGAGGTILHYDGSGWEAMESGTTVQLLAVWGTSGSDVYAVGMNGTILHYGAGTP